jgi:hypothetical protein
MILGDECFICCAKSHHALISFCASKLSSFIWASMSFFLLSLLSELRLTLGRIVALYPASYL